MRGVAHVPRGHRRDRPRWVPPELRANARCAASRGRRACAARHRRARQCPPERVSAVPESVQPSASDHAGDVPVVVARCQQLVGHRDVVVAEVDAAQGGVVILVVLATLRAPRPALRRTWWRPCAAAVLWTEIGLLRGAVACGFGCRQPVVARHAGEACRAVLAASSRNPRPSPPLTTRTRSNNAETDVTAPQEERDPGAPPADMKLQRSSRDATTLPARCPRGSPPSCPRVPSRPSPCTAASTPTGCRRRR